MKLSIFALSVVCANAFVPAPAGGRTGSVPLKNMADDVGIPCEDECALESFPNLPESVHPGVLSGQAQMDLLAHAKANGTYFLNHDKLDRILHASVGPDTHFCFSAIDVI